MKASIKFLSSQRETNNGFPICVELISNKKRIRKTIGNSFPEYWDDEHKEVFKEHPAYYDLASLLLFYKAKIHKINHSRLTFEQAKDLIFEGDDKKAFREMGIIEFFQIRMDEKKAKKESYRAYAGVQQVLEKYLSRDIPINEITYEWLNAFVLHKLKTGCKEGGVMSYLRTMRAVYKEAQRRTSLRIKQDNPFTGIIKSTNTKPVIQLSCKELNTLHTFLPKKFTSIKTRERIKQVIDVFLFQFYIGGQDYVDVALLTWENIDKNRIKFQRYKLRSKKNGGPIIDNLLSPEALQIIEAHGTKNNDRIFSFIPNPKTHFKEYQVYQKNINRTLKLVSEGLKFKNVIKTKSARYIFRTYAGELLIHDLIIMKLQGHTPQGVTFNYQGAISYKVIDESHIKILNIIKKM